MIVPVEIPITPLVIKPQDSFEDEEITITTVKTDDKAKSDVDSVTKDDHKPSPTPHTKSEDVSLHLTSDHLSITDVPVAELVTTA